MIPHALVRLMPFHTPMEIDTMHNNGHLQSFSDIRLSVVEGMAVSSSPLNLSQCQSLNKCSKPDG